MPFKNSGNTGDAALSAEAPGVERLFEAMAMGLYRLMTSPAGVEPEVTRSISLTAGNAQTLLVNFLNELIFLSDTLGFIASVARVGIKERDSLLELTAELKGEDKAFSRHPRGLLVKAATYHRLSVETGNGAWRARVILDI